MILLLVNLSIPDRLAQLLMFITRRRSVISLSLSLSIFNLYNDAIHCNACIYLQDGNEFRDAVFNGTVNIVEIEEEFDAES